MKLLDYLYYRFYLLGRRGGNQSVPKNKATMMFAIWQLWNLLTLSLLVSHFYEFDFEMTRPFAFIFGASLLSFNFLFFYRRHNKIEAKFSKENSKRKNIGYIVVAAYIVFTIISYIVVVNYLSSFLPESVSP